MTVLNRLRD